MAQILVVDDESNIRMMLKLALAHVGYTVETASDGYEGLERCGQGGTFDLVILDQRMPGWDGLEVLREMRKRDSKACVLMITAFGPIDLATEAMQAGATDFLRKPFTVDTLRQAVAVALRGQALGPEPVNPYAFDTTTVNGFRLRLQEPVKTASDGTITGQFFVEGATGEKTLCPVQLPPYLVELVKAHTDREEVPGGTAFWQALCAEALANYLWQHSELPPAQSLIVEDLTSGLRHFVDALLSRGGKI